MAILAPEKAELRSTAVEAVTLGASAALAIPCDIADEHALEAATQRIEHELGPIDVWVDTVVEPLPKHRGLAIAAGALGLLGLGVGALLVRRHFMRC